MLLAELGTSWTRIAQVLVAGLAVYALVAALTRLAGLRRRDLLIGLIDNRPVLLLAGPVVLDGQLGHVRLSRAELWSQLRQHGVHSLDQVQAVVFETSGKISVMRKGEPLDDELLQGVRGAEMLR